MNLISTVSPTETALAGPNHESFWMWRRILVSKSCLGPIIGAGHNPGIGRVDAICFRGRQLSWRECKCRSCNLRSNISTQISCIERLKSNVNRWRDTRIITLLEDTMTGFCNKHIQGKTSIVDKCGRWSRLGPIAKRGYWRRLGLRRPVKHLNISSPQCAESTTWRRWSEIERLLDVIIRTITCRSCNNG